MCFKGHYQENEKTTHRMRENNKCLQPDNKKINNSIFK